MSLTGILLVLFLADLSGQNQANKMDISSKLTKKHVRIPGTHLYLIPLKDFDISKTFIGLSNKINTNIIVMDIWGGNFYNQSKEFNKETFEQTGLTIYDYKEFKINNNNAKYIFTNSLNSAEKNLMVAFGDSTFTILITANMFAEADKIFNKVEKCLLSAIYNKEIIVDPFETANFSIDLSKSDYEFDKYSSGGFIYKIQNSDSIIEQRPYFIVTQMPYQDATDEILKITTKQMIDKAKEYGTNDLKLDFKKLEINGCQSIETSGYGINNGGKILYYLLVVGKQNNVTVFNSIIKKDYDENLEKLINVAHSIKLK